MFIIMGSFDLNPDEQGLTRVPDCVASELRRNSFVLEPALDARGRPILLGLPRAAAPHARPGHVDGLGRLSLPADAIGGVASRGGVLRLIGCGQYFVIEG